ncbi:hypothetical protein IPZ69_20505 [Streptomyces olivochromogenes]|nr:hypothetical protein [Streptomyces olivochromogenes]
MPRTPLSGARAATSATLREASSAAIDWSGVRGRRTVSPPIVQDRIASTTSMNCVARTMKYGEARRSS